MGAQNQQLFWNDTESLDSKPRISAHLYAIRVSTRIDVAAEMRLRADRDRDRRRPTLRRAAAAAPGVESRVSTVTVLLKCQWPGPPGRVRVTQASKCCSARRRRRASFVGTIYHGSTQQWPLLHRKDYLQGSEILAIIWKVGSCYMTCYIAGGMLYHIFLLYNMLYAGVT
jgi:hypothetical protein